MNGRSKLYFNGKLMNLSELTNTEHKQFAISTKKAIAKSLGKKAVRVVEK